jgi:hypothetical protein
MRTTSSILAGTVAASLVAGPLLLSSVLASETLLHPGKLYAVNGDQIGFVLLMLAASAPVGFFFACLPIFFGAATMSWLGRHAPESRSSFVWGAVGVALASIVSIPFIMVMGPVPDENPLPLLMAFSISGAICAVICRRMTSWPDEF